MVTRKAAPNATLVAKVVVAITGVSALGGGCCAETDDARFARWYTKGVLRHVVAHRIGRVLDTRGDYK